MFMKTQKPLVTTIYLGLFLLIVFTISCNSLDGSERDDLLNREDIYQGIYLQGIEDVWFKPCKKHTEVWKPILTIEMVQTINPILFENWPANLYLTVKGTPTKKGEYKGFFTRYDREIEVIKIMDLQATKSDDCS